MGESLSPAARRAIAWSLVLGFAVRVWFRLYSGAEDFWSNGYTVFFTLAQNIAAGRGLFLESGFPTSFRVPIYAVFLAAVTLGRKAFLPVMLAQALIGVGTVWCAALLALEMFGAAAAVTAPGITAIYPYYVVHDTALQETSLFTLLTAVAVILLRRASSSGSVAATVFAGLVLGLDVLTRATIAPFAATLRCGFSFDGRARQ